MSGEKARLYTGDWELMLNLTVLLVSQMMITPLISPEAINPVVSKATVYIEKECPARDVTREEASEGEATLRSQTLIVLSCEPLAIMPGLDGSKANEKTAFPVPWPVRVATKAYVFVFHILIRESEEQLVNNGLLLLW